MRLLAFVLGLTFSCSNAFAATAGTVVSNTATLSFDIDGTSRTVSSNTVRLVLAEKLDVAVKVGGAATRVEEANASALPFRVTNAGNGTEVFDLTARIEGDGATILAIAADENGDGVYDPKVDRNLPNGQLPLDAGKDAVVFVIVGGDLVNHDVSLTATADTGSGKAGTVFDGRGDGGGDAVVGETGATATAVFRISARLQEPTLVKSQTVLSPDGGTRAVKGTIVTYRLEASFPHATAAVEIADPIPAGTAYVPGSLTLDGAALTDAEDSDAGKFDGSSIGVALGDVSAGTRIIIFQVKIQ